MKVLFIIDRLGAGGKERQLVEVLKGLVLLQNVQCQLVVLSSEIHYTELQDLQVKTLLIKRKRKYDVSVFKKLWDICKSFKPDIIHSWESMASLYVLPAAKYYRIKVINSIIRNAPAHINRLSQTWLRTRLLLRFTEVILANSQAGLKSYHIPKHKSFCIYNGFDFNRIKNLEEESAIRSKLGISAPKVVGMVGKFTDKKDYQAFILAAKRLLAKRNDVVFVTIGDGKNLNACKKLAVDPNILFLGNQQQVESIINVFDVGVLATFTEGISNSIMEYMALAKPVVATDGGGTSEIIIDKETGFLVKQGDVNDLADHIEMLLNDEPLSHDMGNRGKERLQEVFNLEKMTHQMVALYQQCLLGKPSREFQEKE